MYRTRLVLAVLTAFVLTPAAFGQDYRFEITPHYGFRFGGSLDVSPNPIVSAYNQFSVQSSGSMGVSGGYYLMPNFLLNFDWSRQSSNIDGQLAAGGTDKDLVGFTMNTFHFAGQYHFLGSKSKLRPFVSVGMGWTSYGPEVSTVQTSTRFSQSVGGGVKYFFNQRVGAFTQFRYLPTFVHSKPGGIWCDWNCLVLPDSDYLSQGDLQFGVSLRF